jgi:acetyltransferase-like isoleucine patch superfamily enzyme
MSAVKIRVKELFGTLGLLPTVDAIYGNAHQLAQLPDATRQYLYNHWITHVPSNRARLAYLRAVLGVPIGEHSFVHMGCFFAGTEISIGHHTVIGRQCTLSGAGATLTIGNNVSITARAYVFTASHDVNSPDFASTHSDVTIDDHAWIGAGAMIMPGVHVGRGAVLGAMATATKDLPEFSIWAGVPARQIGTRSRDLAYTLRYEPYLA